MLLAADSNSTVTKSMGLGLISFADCFVELKPGSCLTRRQVQNFFRCNCSNGGKFQLHIFTVVKPLKVHLMKRFAIPSLKCHICISTTEKCRKLSFNLVNPQARSSTLAHLGLTTFQTCSLLSRENLKIRLDLN